MKQISWNEIQDRAVKFASTWKNETREKGESQSFWSDFLNIFGIDRKRSGAYFEYAIKKNSGKQGFIDLFYPGKLLAEQKSGGKSLDSAELQAFEYLATMPDYDLPEAIIVSDFATFQFIDLETRKKTEFSLEELHKHVKLFGFLLGQTSKNIAEQDPVNRKAAEAMARLHNELREDNYTGHDLELLLVRLVFLMFADDSGIFERATLLDYINNRTSKDGSDLGALLVQIFQILNIPKENRQSSLDEALSSLPYVNGGLFAEPIQTPSFNSKMRQDLLNAMDLDWSKVSPAIFGSMFQGVMDEKQRRNLGAHYTSEVNILKVIRPLFLDDLYEEFRKALQSGPRKKIDELRALQNKIANLKFLDPACGAGNFLVITYRELRKLEHKIVDALSKDPNQQDMLVGSSASPLKVNVDQMYGIEIEEFPALVAQTALWLTDHQMNVEYSRMAASVFKRIPLTTSATIVNANALTTNWADVITPSELSYILGNPPFIGSKMMTSYMRQQLLAQFPNVKSAGVLDFVTAWYAKAVQFMKLNPQIQTALVSTNSIIQGEQVPVLWQYMFSQGARINFLHQTFKWSNDAKGNAAVYCTIVGFALLDKPEKRIFEYADIKGEPNEITAKNINGYGIDAPSIFIDRRGKPLCNVPPMSFGNMPLDGGNLLLTPAEKSELIAKEPAAEKYIKPFIGAKEFLRSEEKWSLWLKDASPSDLRQLPNVMKRVQAVKEFRLASNTPSTNQHAIRPTEFRDTNNPQKFIVVPRVSSERREYVPMAIYQNSEIAGDTCQVIPNTTLYHFGILTSRMHMAWMRAVAGRLKSDYRYSKDIVYNNFIWPEATEVQKVEIETLAQSVLDARAQFPDSSLADLYDPRTMPPVLAKAHAALDRAVDKLYGLPKEITDTDRVAKLFDLYQEIAAKIN